MPLTIRSNRLPAAEVQRSVALELSEIPLAGSFDVVVVGGGTGGAPAAISAGQEGLKTAVIEPQSFLGGIGTGGGIHMYYHGIQTGVQFEMDERMDAWSARIGGKASGFHPESKKLALQEMADEAGVQCFYRTFFVGAVMDGDAIVGIVADGDDGLFWLQAKVVIDSTGDADVAAAAGAPFHFGRAGDHAPQPFSLAPGHVKNAESVTFRNFDAGYVDPTNAKDQTRAQLEGRSHLRLDKHDEAQRMIYVSPILGLRESRFIDAEYVVTLEDQDQQRRFPDVVARAKAHYDNHAFDYENESLEAAVFVGAGHWHTQLCHDVPYRCLVPKKIENLLVACRAAGMTHDAHNLFRMQRDIQSLGEVAAVAAAQALRQGTTVRKVNVRAVQERLVQRKALPESVLAGNGAGSVISEDAELKKLTVPELIATFCKKREPAALFELRNRGSAVSAELKTLLSGVDENARLMAAMALALQGDASGAEVLKATLASRRADKVEGHRTQPRWLAALFMLESLGIRKTGTLPLLCELLKDEALDVHKAVAAIRSLKRNATGEEAAELIRATLRREINTTLVLQHSTGAAGRKVVSDRRFELDLAAAEALNAFGHADEARALAEKHLNDERALVRNYARKVLAAISEPVAV